VTPAQLVRRKLDDQRRIVEAILADFIVDPTWTKGAIRRMVVVEAVARRLGVRVSHRVFVPRVNRAVRCLGARPIRPFNKAMWRGLRRRE
jgi:hypothetical protein